MMFRPRRLVMLGAITLAALPLTAHDKGPSAPAPTSPPAGASTAASSSPCFDCEATAPTVPADTVVLRLDGQSYTAAEFDRIIAAMVPPATPITTAVRRRVAGILTEMRLLSAEAVRRGLDQDARVQQSLALARDQALGQAVAYHVAEGILNKEARAHYEANKAGYEQVRVRHILIRTPDSPVPDFSGKAAVTDQQAKAKAEDVWERLLKGEDFAALAAAVSEDTNGSRGGELPRFRRMQMIPEFENAAFKLRAGDISEPVKTMFGYHIIQVLERGPAPFDQVKAEIGKHLEQDHFNKFLQELKQAHPATLEESYFGPATPPAGPPPSLLLRRGP